MYKCVQLKVTYFVKLIEDVSTNNSYFYYQVDDGKHKHYINDAVKYYSELPDDVTIISGEMDEIQTNKYLLSLFSPSLRHLLSTPCCISPTLLLPDCSTFSIKYRIYYNIKVRLMHTDCARLPHFESVLFKCLVQVYRTYARRLTA